MPSAELSYFVGRSCQSQGFASEAITGMVAQMFGCLQFNRIFLRVISKNYQASNSLRSWGSSTKASIGQHSDVDMATCATFTVFALTSADRVL